MKASSSDFLALMAVGDAFGMKYEVVEHAIPVGPEDLFYGPHPRFTDYQTGHYTDDTQMALANAELLLQSYPKIKQRDFVEAWLQAFQRDPRPGYSTYMYQLMNENLSPEEFCSRVHANKGTTSGAAMRAAPLGLLADLELVKKITCEQAEPTHNTAAGRTSALFVALSTHYLHHGGKPEYLESFLNKHLGENWCSERNGFEENAINGLKIVSQTLKALKAGGDTVSKILLASVSQAENLDADTVGAMAMVIASRRGDLKNDLTDGLKLGLENGSYGRDYIRRVDERLAKTFPRSNQYATFQP